MFELTSELQVVVGIVADATGALGGAVAVLVVVDGAPLVVSARFYEVGSEGILVEVLGAVVSQIVAVAAVILANCPLVKSFCLPVTDDTNLLNVIEQTMITAEL